MLCEVNVIYIYIYMFCACRRRFLHTVRDVSFKRRFFPTLVQFLIRLWRSMKKKQKKQNEKIRVHYYIQYDSRQNSLCMCIVIVILQTHSTVVVFENDPHGTHTPNIFQLRSMQQKTAVGRQYMPLLLFCVRETHTHHYHMRMSYMVDDDLLTAHRTYMNYT